MNIELLLINIIILLISYTIFNMIKIHYSKKLTIHSNSINSKFIKKFQEVTGGFPEISETEDILNIIKNNDIQECEWERIINENKWSDELIFERYGRARR